MKVNTAINRPHSNEEDRQIGIDTQGRVVVPLSENRSGNEIVLSEREKIINEIGRRKALFIASLDQYPDKENYKEGVYVDPFLLARFEGLGKEFEEEEALKVLNLAIQLNDYDAVSALIDCEVRLDSGRENPLHNAVRVGNVNIIRLLLQEGAAGAIENGVCVFPELLREALNIAASFGNLEALKLLIEFGANPNPFDEAQGTPLARAAESGHMPIIEFLVLECGASGSLPIQIAASEGHCDVVDFLLRFGADLNQRSVNGDTLLHLAAYSGNCKLINYFLTLGLDLSKLNYKGLMPAHIAALQNHFDALYLLITEANKDQADQRGFTVLDLLIDPSFRPEITDRYLNLVSHLMTSNAKHSLEMDAELKKAFLEREMGLCSEIHSILLFDEETNWMSLPNICLRVAYQQSELLNDRIKT